MTAALEPAHRALEAGLRSLGLDLEPEARTRLLDYIELLTRWNRRFNLTGTRAPAEIVTRHLLDSLSVTPFLRGDRVLDAGTGAGLPGLVLAVARPEAGFTLLDSSGKKTRFCIQAAADLKIGNVTVVRARIEDFAPAQRFSCMVSRAFTRAPDLLCHAARLLDPGGLVIMMKGVYPQDELAAIRQAGFDARVTPLAVPGLAAIRHLLLVEVP